MDANVMATVGETSRQVIEQYGSKIDIDRYYRTLLAFRPENLCRDLHTSKLYLWTEELFRPFIRMAILTYLMATSSAQDQPLPLHFHFQCDCGEHYSTGSENWYR